MNSILKRSDIQSIAAEIRNAFINSLEPQMSEDRAIVAYAPYADNTLWIAMHLSMDANNKLHAERIADPLDDCVDTYIQIFAWDLVGKKIDEFAPGVTDELLDAACLNSEFDEEELDMLYNDILNEVSNY